MEKERRKAHDSLSLNIVLSRKSSSLQRGREKEREREREREKERERPVAGFLADLIMHVVPTDRQTDRPRPSKNKPAIFSRRATTPP